MESTTKLFRIEGGHGCLRHGVDLGLHGRAQRNLVVLVPASRTTQQRCSIFRRARSRAEECDVITQHLGGQVHLQQRIRAHRAFTCECIFPPAGAGRNRAKPVRCLVCQVDPAWQPRPRPSNPMRLPHRAGRRPPAYQPSLSGPPTRRVHLPLPVHVQCDLRCRKDSYTPALAQQFACQVGGLIDHMLAIVQDEKSFALCKRAGDEQRSVTITQGDFAPA